MSLYSLFFVVSHSIAVFTNSLSYTFLWLVVSVKTKHDIDNNLRLAIAEKHVCSV